MAGKGKPTHEPPRTKKEQKALEKEMLAYVEDEHVKAVWKGAREFEIPGGS